MASFRVTRAPLGEQADREAAEQAQDPDGVAVADAAVVLAGGGIEALVQAAFDTPVLPIGLEPLLGVEAVGFAAGQQPNGFGLVRADMPVELGGLRDMREADLLRRGRAGVNLSAFATAAVAFLAPSHGLCHGPRGKNPPRWRGTGSAPFAGGPSGCL